MRARRWLRTAAHAALALAPPAIKLPIYRHVFGFEIAPGARIGVSLCDVDHLRLGPGARIGHGNALLRTTRIELDEGAEIGFCNILRGGDQIHMAKYSTVMRFNVLNSIPEPETDNPTEPRLSLGPGAFVVSGHRLDFTDRITLGTNVIVAGRNSSLWTHNRQTTQPIEVGDFCYLGSEVRLAPGASLGAFSILGMGAVLSGHAEGRAVLGGVPAKPIRALNDDDERVLRKKSKKGIPEDLY
jgi:acetyltransferase-like isoleucine patch superfamily enzyme